MSYIRKMTKESMIDRVLNGASPTSVINELIEATPGFMTRAINQILRGDSEAAVIDDIQAVGFSSARAKQLYKQAKQEAEKARAKHVASIRGLQVRG